MKKEEKVSESWIEAINFNHLFRLKGKNGLYSPLTARNKAGMVLFEEFLNPENRTWIDSNKVVCLASLKFDKFSLLGIFRRIEKKQKIQLKPYELKQIKTWFNYLEEKLNQYVEEGEKEMENELKEKENGTKTS